MTTAAIRNRLHDYIRLADEKKIKAIYTMLEGEIEENVGWWEDNDLIKKLDKECNEWRKGNAKGYTTNEVNEHIASLQAKRKRK